MLQKKAPLVLLAAATALVTACSQPHSIPTGYVYHGNVYKSANPPESPKFTSAQRKAMGPQQSEQFRQAVYKLVESLTLRAGMPPKPVHVLQPVEMNAFYSNIDNDVRESLRHIGYRLADTPDGAYVFTYNAQILTNEKGKPAPDAAGNNVRIALQVFDKFGKEGKMLTEEAGLFRIDGAQDMTISYPTFRGVHAPETAGPIATH